VGRCETCKWFGWAEDLYGQVHDCRLLNEPDECDEWQQADTRTAEEVAEDKGDEQHHVGRGQ